MGNGAVPNGLSYRAHPRLYHHVSSPRRINSVAIEGIADMPRTPAARRSDANGVESRCGAAALGRTYLLPPLSSGGASVVRPWLRFHTPLIEPDMQVSRIRLSDKTSRLHPRHVAPKRAQAYEPEVPVEVREWI